ncbi:MAG: hypothetical protein PVF56_14815 [Desulfobacterales bacterium]|jgi:hypothetical protein
MYPKGELRPVEKVMILNNQYDSACQLHRPKELAEQASVVGYLLFAAIGSQCFLIINDHGEQRITTMSVSQKEKGKSAQNRSFS